MLTRRVAAEIQARIFSQSPSHAGCPAWLRIFAEWPVFADGHHCATLGWMYARRSGNFLIG
jgi:hypothetical protein